MAGAAPPRTVPAALGALLLAALIALAVVLPDASVGQDREQTTQLISRSTDGDIPNGPSTNGVISNDRRWARLIAFESDASDIVKGDTNRLKDVFAVKRAGSFGNKGTPWARPNSSILVSRGKGGKPANGPSYAPAVDGSFDTLAKCVAFLSAASNLVSGDTNKKADAFLATSPGSDVRRVSLGRKGKQLTNNVTQVAVSGDCTKVAFVAGGGLYVWTDGKTRRLNAPGGESDPSFATGKTNDLVFGASGGGIYLSEEASATPKKVVSVGRNPAYNSIKRQVVTYEKVVGGRVQIFARDLGKKERMVSHFQGEGGDADSRNPVIGNSGYYVAFETDAGNLQTNAGGQREDGNGQPDSYLYSDVRDVNLLQSVAEKAEAMPRGGANPSLAFYANYILFQSAAPLATADPSAQPQVFMRYLGGV
jgi:hypothetical protein